MILESQVGGGNARAVYSRGAPFDLRHCGMMGG
jgi:hypothetical protein